ncbi:unnamed protein product [Effrenium voratum]|uniref:Mitochondrial cardiolipin hydrolase n=1 Tax=Effrenium voratum TaxID=2562239 RepID=A0AA36IZB8_9DINO|nr:unnamed protein product [Effrenium voratum]
MLLMEELQAKRALFQDFSLFPNLMTYRCSSANARLHPSSKLATADMPSPPAKLAASGSWRWTGEIHLVLGVLVPGLLVSWSPCLLVAWSPDLLVSSCSPGLLVSWSLVSCDIMSEMPEAKIQPREMIYSSVAAACRAGGHPELADQLLAELRPEIAGRRSGGVVVWRRALCLGGPVRFSADGPLRLAALSSPQTVLLCFDVDAELLSGLVGFALCRTTLKEGKNTGEVWIGDPRRGSWRGDGAKTAEADRPAEEGAGDASPEADEEETTAPGGGWQRALRCAIRDFKWGDYTVEPNSQYSYTLYAVRGDEELGVQDARDQGPSTAGPGLHVAAQVQLQVDTQETDGDQVHFNRGVAGSQRFARLAMGTKEQGPRSLEQWQWLSRGLEEAMLGFINRAEEGWSLRCALYEAHYPPVMRALSAARRRGASVQIVVDWKQAAWSEDRKVWTQKGPQHLNYWALAEAGLLDSGCVIFRRKPPSAIGHNKFMVLMTPDGLPVAVWTGSTNVTAGAIFGHSNVGHVVTQRPLCEKYWAYWQRLAEDPEKKDLAAFNEKLTPLPKEDWTRLVLFSPRLRWADSLAFIAQLILRARHSVAFTAAFGISREISPALLAAGSEGIGAAIPTYLLLESQGNWQASREAVQQLQRLSNVRVAFGTHLEAAGGSSGAWVPEKLTGLNEHVRYVHTKILLIDMFSDQPIARLRQLLPCVHGIQRREHDSGARGSELVGCLHGGVLPHL